MLKRFLANKDNCVETTHLLLDSKGVKVTRTTLEQQLTEHPNYPSLLSISDVLHNFGVDNLSIKSNPENIGLVEPPFIAQISPIKSHQVFFTVVRAIKDDTIDYYHPKKHIWEVISKEEFAKQWP